MTDEDIQNLLGGFATDTLTPEERDVLYTAALQDQELFNALADEQILRDFLSDPASRRRLLQLLQPQESGILEWVKSWIRWPASWAIVGGVVAALVVVVAIRESRPPASVDTVKTASSARPPSELVIEEAREMSRRDAVNPAVVMKREAVAAPKMKVAVLEFDSGPVQAKKSESKKADLGKTASDLLGKKLDTDGYSVIDRKQVDKAMQSQKLDERQMDASAAASVGRSLGADAVIMGSVKPSAMFDRNIARQEAPALRSKAAAMEAVQVSATAINTQNAASLGFAQGGQAANSGLQDAVDQVAVSLGQQIQQNSRARISGLVTDVNAKTLTLNVGAQAGVKAGDRLDIRRAGKIIGRVVVNAAQDSSSVGVFDGPDTPKIGDSVVNQ